MKKLFGFLEKYWAYLLLFAAWLPATFYNTKIYWMLVDDGYNVVFSRTLFEKLTSLNIAGFFSQLLEAGGRFRPVYWIYHMLVWIIGRNSFQFHHLVHMLVIGLTIYFIYRILHKLTESKTISFLGAITYLLIPINSENILRLGPQEPLVALFLSIYFYLIIEGKRKILPILFLFLAIFTKETSVAILPVVILYYLLSKTIKSSKIKTLSIYSVVSVCVFSLLTIIITTVNRSGYSTNYIFDQNIILHNFLVFTREISIHTLYLFPLIPVLYIGRLVASYIRKRKMLSSKADLFELVFFSGFVVFMVIQLPWKYDLTRYLMPSIFFLITFTFIEINNLLKMFRNNRFVINHKRILKTIVITVCIYVFSIWGIVLLSKERNFVSYRNLTSRLAELPRNTLILVNTYEGEASMEIVDEISIHLSEFWGRTDMEVQYLDTSRMPGVNYVILSTNRIPPKYSEQELTSRFGDKIYTVENRSKEIIVTTPLELIKQTATKVTQLIVYRKPFTFEGIYTFYLNNNKWDIYSQNK